MKSGRNSDWINRIIGHKLFMFPNYSCSLPLLQNFIRFAFGSHNKIPPPHKINLLHPRH